MDSYSVGIIFSPSYYIVIPLLYLFSRLGYAVKDAVAWFFSPTAQTVVERLQPQPLCYIVNQLDTARRFMWNEVTTAKGPVDPRRHQIRKGGFPK